MSRVLIRFVIFLVIAATLGYVLLLDPGVYKFVSPVALGLCIGWASAVIAEWIYGDECK